MGNWKFGDEQFCENCGRTLRGQKEKDDGLCSFCADPMRGEFVTKVGKKVARRIDRAHAEERDHQHDMFAAAQHDIQRMADRQGAEAPDSHGPSNKEEKNE